MKTIVLAACVTALCLQAAYAQPKIKLHKRQTEIAADIAKFSARYKEIQNLPNVIAKKDAVKDFQQEERKYSLKLGVEFAKTGITDWVGQIYIFESHIAIGDSKIGGNIYFYIDAPDALSKDVRESIKKMKNGDIVMFSIPANVAIKVEKGINGGSVTITIKSSLLTKCDKLSRP